MKKKNKKTLITKEISNIKKLSDIKKIFTIKKAFTLVELLVVIIIIWLLWTIAFVSLVWYTSDARNAKRVTDLNSIKTALNIELNSWADILSFVKNSNNAISTPNIAWVTLTHPTWIYNAWEINHAKLNMKPSNFVDPDWQIYVIWATNLDWWAYQLTASIESFDYKLAKVCWNYIQRLSSNYVIWTVNNNIFRLTNPFDSSKFKLKDTIRNNYDWNLYTITEVSKDWLTLTLSWTPNSNITAIAIATDETSWLIKWKDKLWHEWVVINEWIYLAY